LYQTLSIYNFETKINQAKATYLSYQKQYLNSKVPLTMFSSFRNTQGRNDDNTTASHSTENTENAPSNEDDFVQVKMDIDENYTTTSQETQPALSMKLIPENESIGLQSSKSSTRFCSQITSRCLPDDDSARAPVDVMVALDISGSMTGKKLTLCKETLQLLLRELGPNDRFGLVTFGSEATIVIPARKLSNQSKQIALSSIEKIHTSGCTNMSGGIGLAAQELQSIENPHSVRTLFLLTDGHANAGVSNKDDIVALTKNCLQKAGSKQGDISVHCFGYGVDHDRVMLGEIAQATEGGTYYFVEDDSAISSAFGDALGGVLSVTAQNVTLNIKVAPESANLGVDITKVHHDKAVKNEDGSYSIAVGDFYAEESRDILFDVTLPKEGTKSTSTPLVLASLSYMDTINKTLVNNNQEVEGSLLRPDTSEVSEGNHHVIVQYLRIQTTDVIKRADILASGGNLSAAREAINSQLFMLKNAPTDDEKSSVLVAQMKLELNEILVGLSNSLSYANEGAYKMKSCAMSHTMQRCTESTATKSSAYRSSKKSMLAYKFSKK